MRHFVGCGISSGNLLAGKSGDSLSFSLLIDSSFPYRASMLVAIATQHIASTHTVHRHEASGTRREAYSDQSSYCSYSIVLFFSCLFVLLHS